MFLNRTSAALRATVPAQPRAANDPRLSPLTAPRAGVPAIGPALARARQRWRLWREQPALDAFGRFVDEDRALSDFAARQPELFDPVVNGYLDRALPSEQRVAWLRCTLEAGMRRFGPAAHDALLEDMTLPLFALDGEPASGGRFVADLRIDPPGWHTGLYAVALQDRDARRIATLRFGFVPAGTDDALFIGAIDGATDSAAAAAASTVRRLAHGARPARLLLLVAQALCRATGVTRLVGVDPERAASRAPADEAPVVHDPRFWRDVGGSPEPGAHWDLPVRRPRWDPRAVPAGRRAVYEQRFALLDAIDRALARQGLRRPA